MVVQMHVDGRKNHIIMIVLDVCKRGLQVRLVMIIDQGDCARNVRVPEFLPVFNQAVAHHIANGQRTVIVTLLVRHLIKLPQQRGRQRHTKTADGFFH